MILKLSRNEVCDLVTSVRKILPSLLNQDEKKSCNTVYKKLVKLIEADFVKAAKQVKS